MSPSPTPSLTLHDGIAVVYVAAGLAQTDMALTAAQCRMLTMNSVLNKLAMWDAVNVTGTYTVTSTGARQVVLAKETDIVDSGAAPTLPTPVLLDPQALANGNTMAFADANSALVQFQGVAVSDINKYQDFNVSTDGVNKATIASNFMTLTTKNYMAPVDGSMLISVTGIVFPDFGGTIWARNSDDIVQLMR